MKNRVFMWSCFVMAFLVACSQAEVENPEAEKMPMFISASIDNQDVSPKSRYAIADLQHLSFKEGDEIGLFVDNEEAVQWTFDGSAWIVDGNKTVYWPDIINLHTFRAFYPYIAATSYDAVEMPDLLTQDGDIDNLGKFDFLVAASEQIYQEGGVVDFTTETTSFQHVSALLELKFLEGDDLDGMVINKVILQGDGIASPAIYSFTAGKAIWDESDVALTVVPSAVWAQGVPLYLVVNAVQADAVVKMTVEYEVNGKEYVAECADFVTSDLAVGVSHGYNITVQNYSLEISEAKIQPWTPGGIVGTFEVNGQVKTGAI